MKLATLSAIIIWRLQVARSKQKRESKHGPFRKRQAHNPQGDGAKTNLTALESFRGTLFTPTERQLEADIRAVRASIVGEERILYELRNSHMSVCALQDLRLEREGLAAQIDFLVITRQRNFFIEYKNLCDSIETDETGNFVRKLGGRKREERGFFARAPPSETLPLSATA